MIKTEVTQNRSEKGEGMDNGITWISAAGKEIEINVIEDMDKASVRASIGGESIMESGLIDLAEPKTIGTVTILGTVGPIGLIEARYNRIREIRDNMQADIDARPEVKARKLVAEHNDLIVMVRCLERSQYEADHDRIVKAMANGKAGGRKADFSIEITEAQAKFAKFCAANPEIVAKIEMDESAKTERFLATN